MSASPRTHTCYHCQRSFSTRRAMFQHINDTHNDDSDASNSCDYSSPFPRPRRAHSPTRRAHSPSPSPRRHHSREHRDHQAIQRSEQGGRGRAHVDIRYDDGHGREEHLVVQRVEQQLLFEVTMDVSGSMSGSRIQRALEALETIFERTMRDTDMMGLVMFNSKVQQLHKIMRKRKIDFSKDKVNILGACSGRTALYDGIVHSIQSLRREEPWVRRELQAEHVTVLHLVITDGEDNASAMSVADLKENFLKNPNIQGYHMHVIGVKMDASGRAALEDLCGAHGGKRATLHLADSLEDLCAHVEMVRQALEIVLEVNDGGEAGRRVLRAVADRHNFREVLEMLSRESVFVGQHMGALMQGISKMSLRWK